MPEVAVRLSRIEHEGEATPASVMVRCHGKARLE